MGLPEIIIEFKTRAETAIARSENGIVAVILVDDTKSSAADQSYTYGTAAEIASGDWTDANKRYLNLIFKGGPKKVIVERVNTEDDAVSYTAALARLKNKKWNWLTVPGIAAADTASISEWIITQRAARKTFKAVLANSASNHEGIVNLTTDGIYVGTQAYTTAEYCARIAGLLAGLPLTQSATYQVLDDITSITDSTNPDADIDAGKFIIINDGEKFKVGRAVNSLVTLSGTKTADMKKIKIIEGMDLMCDDIRDSFEENYIGINNIYDNKMLFVGAVNQYFDGLARAGVLDPDGTNEAEIDVEAQRDYLAQHYDVSEYTDDEIKRAKTGSYVFVAADVTFADAIEDLKLSVNMS